MIAVLDQMDAWEINLVLNLRLWCEGPTGRRAAWTDYANAVPYGDAERAWHDFERLVERVITTASRPLVRHQVTCNCVGSDEYIFLHLVRTASDGYLNDAALIATLLSGPAHAEHIALMAGEVGSALRHAHCKSNSISPVATAELVRLH